jgi:hypothetical protein
MAFIAVLRRVASAECRPAPMVIVSLLKAKVEARAAGGLGPRRITAICTPVPAYLSLLTYLDLNPYRSSRTLTVLLLTM